jgi:hypothetical protein
MRDRSPKKCRERYHQNLKSGLTDESITPEEGILIEMMVREICKNWTEIARRLGHRSDSGVRNWWNGSVNRRRRSHMHHNEQPSRPQYNVRDIKPSMPNIISTRDSALIDNIGGPPLLQVSRRVASCARCRSAKVRCDGNSPACTARVQANEPSRCSGLTEEFANRKILSNETCADDLLHGKKSKSATPESNNSMEDQRPSLPTFHIGSSFYGHDEVQELPALSVPLSSKRKFGQMTNSLATLPDSRLFFSHKADAGMQTQHRKPDYIPASYFSASATFHSNESRIRHIDGTGFESSTLSDSTETAVDWKQVIRKRGVGVGRGVEEDEQTNDENSVDELLLQWTVLGKDELSCFNRQVGIGGSFFEVALSFDRAVLTQLGSVLRLVIVWKSLLIEFFWKGLERIRTIAIMFSLHCVIKNVSKSVKDRKRRKREREKAGKFRILSGGYLWVIGGASVGSSVELRTDIVGHNLLLSTRPKPQFSSLELLCSLSFQVPLAGRCPGKPIKGLDHGQNGESGRSAQTNCIGEDYSPSFAYPDLQDIRRS